MNTVKCYNCDYYIQNDEFCFWNDDNKKYICRNCGDDVISQLDFNLLTIRDEYGLSTFEKAIYDKTKLQLTKFIS